MTMMNVTEFANFAADLSPALRVEFNRALEFAESMVMQKAAKLVCSDCMSGTPTLSSGHYFHTVNGTVYMCRADGIYKAIISESPRGTIGDPLPNPNLSVDIGD